ncbi:hypothetical protein [Corynebacterium tuberculostearicum]|uniref:hypothetical protein n=1 Tax=Corynebacterium tuberculostearicum TaxID=38304 RepID=UPI0029351D3D|nr:hypothetical protein [Corynebacterium tuberculostearicum]MDV2433763.1 hypothetical protein [Corynebacterium tuberculostearicum]
MSKASDNARFDEIENLVTSEEYKDKLKAAETTSQLREIGAEAGVDVDDRSDMGKFMHKLKILGIDYKAMSAIEREERQARQHERAEELAQNDATGTRLDVWTGAVESDKGDKGAFALVDETGEAIWFGSFFDNDAIYTPGDIGSAEQSAAEKAVYLARRVQEETGAELIDLHIHTEYPDLDEDELRLRGVVKDSQVAVTVEVDPTDERASSVARMGGFRSLKNVDLASLVELDDE